MPLSQPVSSNAGDKDVQNAIRQESTFPQLSRLCSDFNFQVTQTTPEGSEGFRLTIAEGNEQRDITPSFDRLEQLEHHVNHHMLDILHNYVFDSPLAH